MRKSTLTKEQEVLRAFSGTKEDLTAFIDGLQNDEEYQAWKAAHPERAEARKNMTREQKTEYLADLIMQLAEREQKRAEQEKQEKLRTLLRYQITPPGMFDTINDYRKREKQRNATEMMLLLDMFELGKIYGIRHERARRKGELVKFKDTKTEKA